MMSTSRPRVLSLDEREAISKSIQDTFGIDEKAISFETISSTVSNEMRQDAVVAVIVAAICILIYIWFRFKDIRFAGSAVLALMHDVLIVFCLLCDCADFCQAVHSLPAC